jgi:hypothetical protein
MMPIPAHVPVLCIQIAQAEAKFKRRSCFSVRYRGLSLLRASLWLAVFSTTHFDVIQPKDFIGGIIISDPCSSLMPPNPALKLRDLVNSIVMFLPIGLPVYCHATEPFPPSHLQDCILPITNFDIV